MSSNSVVRCFQLFEFQVKQVLILQNKKSLNAVAKRLFISRGGNSNSVVRCFQLFEFQVKQVLILQNKKASMLLLFISRGGKKLQLCCSLLSTLRVSSNKFSSCKIKKASMLVGVARFELATSCSQSRRDNRATLHPEQLKCK